MVKRTFLIYFLALVIRIAFALPFVHDWDGFVFTRSAYNLLNGETPYQTTIKNDPSIYPDSDKPMIEQWYAYPPLPLLMFTVPLAVANVFKHPLPPILEIFLLKLPFIMGDLLAAFLIRKLIVTKSPKKARKAELLVLFNPLLIWISSAWGMFDIWMVNFLMLFLLAVRAKMPKLAGTWVALACCIKLFPVFFLPMIWIYFINIFKSKRARIGFLACFLLVLAVIITPFFLSSPRGFMNQNLLMHLIRPTQGISIPAIFDYFKGFYLLPSFPLTTVSSLLMILSLVFASLLSLVIVKRSEFVLVELMIVSYMAVLLFNKVTNEQYFVVLIVLLILHLYSKKSSITIFPSRLMGLIKVSSTYGVLIASSILGFHFLSFLLPQITKYQLQTSTNTMVFYLGHLFNLPFYAYPDSLITYYNLPFTITAIILTPFLIFGLILIILLWVKVYKFRSEITANVLTFSSCVAEKFRSSKEFRVSVACVIVIFVALIPWANFYIKETNLLTPVTLIDKNESALFSENPRVGTFYNVWWNNFSHIKSFPYGDWSKTTLTPVDGYYTSKNSYYVEHIRQMKQAGIDFTLVSYHLYDRQRYLTFGHYAEKLGLYYAPLIEAGDILGYSKYRPINNRGESILGFGINDLSKKELTNIILSSLDGTVNNKANLIINGKRAIFIYDGHWFFPSWDIESKNKLAAIIVKKYSKEADDPYLQLSKAWGLEIQSLQDVVDRYPADLGEFTGINPISEDYKTAFLQEYDRFWLDIRKEVEKQYGPIYLLSTYTPQSPLRTDFVIHSDDLINLSAFDNEYFYSLANTWDSWRLKAQPSEIKKIWETQVQAQAERGRVKKLPLFQTVTGEYNDKYARPLLWFQIPTVIDDKNTYDWTWETALKNRPDYILITSWNEFFEGTAIEPSKENGDKYLSSTKKWSDNFKNNHLTIDESETQK